MPESYSQLEKERDEAAAERDKLKLVNAELVEALKDVTDYRHRCGLDCAYDQESDDCMELAAHTKARAVIAKAALTLAKESRHARL